MVRAVKLITEPSGSYNNLSLGAIAVSAGAATADCNGTVGGAALPGTACNDGNACTINDTWNSSCQCIGTSITPIATATAGGATSFCAGGSVVLSANTGTGYTYQWRNGTTTIAGATSSTYTATSSGLYSVVITNSGCSSTSAAITVTVTSLPAATITAGGATSFCTGGSVTLSASTGTGYTYQWRNNGTAISGATSSSYTASASGSYSVTVAANGCTATSSAMSVTVNPLPTASISAGGTTALCTGGSVVLSAATGTGYAYQWRNNGTAISGATASTYTASTSGSFTATVTANGCSATSAAIAVTVGTTPSATVSASGPTTFCSGGSVVLNAASGTGNTYQWRNNGTAISGATSASYTATASGSYSVVVSNGGCSATSTAAAVTVNATPAATITAGGSTSFCTGGSVVLSAGTGTGYTYQWLNNGVNIAGATAASYTATSSGSYTVMVTANGCSAASPATNVTANAGATATITAGGPTTFCSGGSVVLSANTGTGYTYQWRNNGVNISGATSSSYTAATSGSYTVVVTSGSCSTASAAMAVSVTAAPTASISPSGTAAICAGGSVVLSASTGTGYTYQWRNNGISIVGATASSYTATGAGSYSVVVTANGCSAVSAAVAVTVAAAPTATITAGGATSFCTGGSVVLSANTGTGYSYQWLSNGSAINAATASTYTATASGSYAVLVTSGGCSATSAATTVTVNPSPAATVTASGATSFCTGGSVVLSAPAGTGYTYQWRNNGTAITGATVSSYTATSSGSYSVTVTAAACSATSAATQVTVAAAPQATVTAGGATTFCSGGSVLLSANTGSGLTYQWRLNGAAISGATSSSYAASTGGSYTVAVANGGCTTVSSGVQVVVNASPAALITAGGPTAICTSGSVALSANTGSGLTYQWLRNGTALAGSTSSAHSATSAGTYMVQVSNGTCTSTSNAVTVDVYAVPSATITAGGPTTFCSGGSVLLSANTGSGLTYQWRLNGAAISGATASSYAATAAGTYSVVVSNPGCSATSAGASVTVNAAPVVACSSPSSTSVSASVTGGAAPYAYQWNTSPVQTTATASVSAPGSYTVVVTGANGCQATCTATVASSSFACTGFLMVEQGTWGANPTSTNWAGYLASRFANAFPAPGYLTIGCGSRLMRFTTTAAINAALPTYGTPALIPAGTTINPAAPANTLVGQLVAAKLNVRFDELDANFAPYGGLMKNLVVVSGTFAGMTVQQVIDAADQAIGGCANTYTLAALSTALTSINNGHHGIGTGSGYLTCPSGSGMVLAPDESIDARLGAGDLRLAAYPNPSHGLLTVELATSSTEAPFQVALHAITGARVLDIGNGVMRPGELTRIVHDLSALERGIYLLVASVEGEPRAMRIAVE
jgi:hypothetical protein